MDFHLPTNPDLPPGTTTCMGCHAAWPCEPSRLALSDLIDKVRHPADQAPIEIVPPTPPKEVTYFVVAGTEIDAAHGICPVCNVFYLETGFDQLGGGQWQGFCPNGHTWEFTNTTHANTRTN